MRGARALTIFLQSEKYTALMLRKSLAVLLIGFWVVFSGYDLLEDLDFSADYKIKNSLKVGSASVGKFPKLANDHLEHASNPLASVSGFFYFTDSLAVEFQRLDDVHKVFKENLRLYKLHCIFLI
jgi:hypothetical protein